MNPTTIALEPMEPSSDVAEGRHHLMAAFRGALSGPTLIILGGIHGNERAGVLAAARVASRLRDKESHVHGEIVLLRGNTRALERKVRYIDADLNRQWTAKNVWISESANRSLRRPSELVELKEILLILREVIRRARGAIYFVDLHTTSADGKPFATVGDTLRNRRFALAFPLTVVLGLEEQIDGTLLEYLNNLGVITLGVEAGQHDAETSVNHHEAVIWNATIAAGNLRRGDVPDLEQYRTLLERASDGPRVVEVRHRHAIVPEEFFQMEAGFKNFQSVRRGQILATDRSGEIKAVETGLILLPLYQPLGDDGFFLGRVVKRFWLRLSGLLRKLKVGDYIRLLPGVRRDPFNKDFFIVNTRIAWLLPLQIFHLLGFRRRRWIGNHLTVSRRSYDLEGPAKIVI